MEQMLKELSLYDLTGYFLPGIVVVWSIMFVANAILFRRTRDHIKPSLFALVIAGYITGHIIQTIATFIEEDLLPKVWRQPEFWQLPDQLYSAKDTDFKNAITDVLSSTFGKLADYRPLYLCQTYLQVHHLDGFTEVLFARYAFFKGLTLALFISCCAFALEAFWRRRQAKHRRRVLIMAGVLLIATGLTFLRMVKFEHYYVDQVYRTFYIDVLSNKTSGSVSLPDPETKNRQYSAGGKELTGQ